MREGERDAVLDWLEKSGLALELRVARTLRAAHLNVTDPFHYKDMISEARREGDVLAWAPLVRETDPELLLVIECKHTEKQETQWVGVRPTATDARSSTDPTEWFGWSRRQRREEDSGLLLDFLLRKQLLDPTSLPCSRVLTAHRKDNPAWDACRQAMSATWGAANEHLVDSSGYWTGSKGIALAIVVTTARLKVCSLSRSGSLDLAEVDHFEVLTETPRRTNRPTLVINESWLPTLIECLAENHPE